MVKSYVKPSTMATMGNHFGSLAKAKVPNFRTLAVALQKANTKPVKVKAPVKKSNSKSKLLSSTSTTFNPNTRGWGGLVSPKSPIGSKPTQVTSPVRRVLNPNIKVMSPISISAAQKAAAKPINQVLPGGQRLL